MRRRKLKLFFACSVGMLLACQLLLTACSGEGQSEHAMDKTGQYILSEDGEAMIQDQAFLSDYAVDDNYRVFYEIFVGSFSDSDGDGIGDLRGIINRFDYLNDGDPNSGTSLGVEGLWLTPIFQSPSYHKYDVTDYYTIDPSFGTQEDLAELITLCHERNVKIILDLPINHTGSSNAWFSYFKAAHKDGRTEDPYYDFYSFYTKGEGSAEGRTFAEIPGTDDYYECNFSGSMPELNFDSVDVRAQVLDVAKFYLDMGIDGFRFDAAKYIYLGDNVKSAAFWDWYLAELRSIKSDIYTVAEVWDSDGVTDIYYSAMNCFDFTTSQSSGLIAETAKYGNVNKYTAYVESYINRTRGINETAMIVPFITNHDMDRAAGFLTAASGHMKMAANLYILSSGSPFIYYGEELGMRGSRGGANTDANRRLAMLWGDGDTVKDPAGTTYSASNQTETTAVTAKEDGDSLYNYYKKLIMLRNANPEIARGQYKALSFSDTKLGGFTSTWQGSTVCVLHNTTMNDITVDVSRVTDLTFSEISGYIGAGEASLDGSSITLGAQTSVVLR